MVLGNARSRTSVAVGVLKRLGVAIEGTEVPDEIFAPKGYFGCLRVRAINCKIYELLTGQRFKEPH